MPAALPHPIFLPSIASPLQPNTSLYFVRFFLLPIFVNALLLSLSPTFTASSVMLLPFYGHSWVLLPSLYVIDTPQHFSFASRSHAHKIWWRKKVIYSLFSLLNILLWQVAAVGQKVSFYRLNNNIQGSNKNKGRMPFKISEA